MIIDAEIFKKAKELYAANGGSIERVAWDLSLGNPAAGVARALGSPDGLGLTAEEVARALGFPRGCNFSYGRIARALRDGLDLSAAKVADALYSEDGLNLNAAKVAWALKDGLDLNAAKVAWALYYEDGLDLNATEVADALYSKDGLNLDATDVAQVLNYNLGLDAERIAKTLRDGLDLDAEEFARVLRDGLDLSIEDTAKAMMSGLGWSMSAVARELFPFVKWDPVELFNSLQGCGMKMTNLISAMLNAPERFNAGDIAGVFQKGFGLSIPEVAKRLFEEEPNLDVESRALTFRMGLGAGITKLIDILRDNGVAAADAKKTLLHVFPYLLPKNIEEWIDKSYGHSTRGGRTTDLFSCRMEFYNNLDCDGSPFSESRFSPSTLGQGSLASCLVKAVKLNAASESGLDDMTGVRVELKNSDESLCFKTDLASVEKVLEMIQHGVIKKTDPNSLFRWDEEYQIFSIGGSGSVVVADLDFPIVRVEGNACVEIASVKGRAEIRNDAIVSIGQCGSLHVTDRASCVAKVVVWDANLWGSGTLTVGSAGNLVNRGMNPILVQTDPVVGEPPASYRSASEIKAAKNASRKGIK